MNQYETINGWTKTSMIDHIKANFKGKSVKSNYEAWIGESCLYRGPGGKKCAVGMFIPDDKYSKDMENKNVLAGELLGAQVYFPLSMDNMAELQQIHDYSEASVTLQRMLEWIEINVK